MIHKEELSPLQKRILFFLRDKHFITRNEMALSLGIPRTTLYDNLEPLVQRGLVHKFSTKRDTSKGRPFVYYTVLWGVK